MAYRSLPDLCVLLPCTLAALLPKLSSYARDKHKYALWGRRVVGLRATAWRCMPIQALVLLVDHMLDWHAMWSMHMVGIPSPPPSPKHTHTHTDAADLTNGEGLTGAYAKVYACERRALTFARSARKVRSLRADNCAFFWSLSSIAGKAYLARKPRTLVECPHAQMPMQELQRPASSTVQVLFLSQGGVVLPTTGLKMGLLRPSLPACHEPCSSH